MEKEFCLKLPVTLEIGTQKRRRNFVAPFPAEKNFLELLFSEVVLILIQTYETGKKKQDR